jgi:hypothetical protein
LAALPADQLVESHHQPEGKACNTNEDDAKEYALHVLTTAALQDSSNEKSPVTERP